MNKYRFINIILRSWYDYFRNSGFLGLLQHILASLYALVSVLSIVLMEKIFTTIINSDNITLNIIDIAMPLIIFVSVLTLQQILNGAENLLFYEVSYKNKGKFMSSIQTKIGKLEAIRFENSDFLDNVNEIKELIEEESLDYLPFASLQIFSYYAVFFIALYVYLYSLSPNFIFLIILSFIPAILGEVFRIKLFSKLYIENAPLRRQSNYYKEVIVSKRFFKETRMLGAFGFFEDKYKENLKLLLRKEFITAKKSFFIKFSLDILSVVGFGVSIFILFRSVMSGEVSLGGFMAVFAGLSSIFSLAHMLVSDNVGTSIEVFGRISNYYKFMDLEEVRGIEFTSNSNKGIVSRNVSFKYPNREEYSIKNISLSIHSGETIALVGLNGSGKSTLIKLLMGLYKPLIGKIEIFDMDTSKVKSSYLYKDISGVFQNFQRYKMTLRENVYISNPYYNYEDVKITSSLEKVRFMRDDITLDTMISPEFSGEDLSGGEWQRIAIARAMYRNNKILLLDEPTSSIDPVEESRIFLKFKELAKNKTAIIVTHRLASTKFADRVIVLKDGEIAESGTHQSLLDLGGVYSKMWTSQQSWYIRD
ncbi:MAG: ABC transporter ATP-binding protein/permease [Defluviitaleaceae bacterium]|nr:ABC transporter ATP-binding protein/permease [Defluviitaleaceae bacterium]